MRCYINRHCLHDWPDLEVALPERLQPVAAARRLVLLVAAPVDWPHCGLPRTHSTFLFRFDVIVM